MRTEEQKDPEAILASKYIHWTQRNYLKRAHGIRLRKPSQTQVSGVKRRLNMRFDEVFKRCKGKDRWFIEKCEKEGDFSHSPNRHICPACRCTNKAGEDTKGDFYGLGPETGHLGVGWCNSCEHSGYRDKNSKWHPYSPTLCMREANRDYENERKAGLVSKDSDYLQQVVEEEQELVNKRRNAVKDLEVISNMATMIEAALEDDSEYVDLPGGKRFHLTEAVNGDIVSMTGKTRAEMIMRWAKTFARIKLDEFNLAKDSYLHIDEVANRTANTIKLFKRMIFRFNEIKENWEEGKRDPVEQIEAEFQQELLDVWDAAHAGGAKK